ncbi:hypothetical protein BD779DRAFT_1476338 [Infundibulicybe gibba]|nr:hypothetical protein BD779DRAFT_1476338 [Infundibulicybe gibba]
MPHPQSTAVRLNCSPPAKDNDEIWPSTGTHVLSTARAFPSGALLNETMLSPWHAQRTGALLVGPEMHIIGRRGFAAAQGTEQAVRWKRHRFMPVHTHFSFCAPRLNSATADGYIVRYKMGLQIAIYFSSFAVISLKDTYGVAGPEDADHGIKDYPN